MNVEGDFRYVDLGAFHECAAFFEYLEECGGNWDDAILHWIFVCEMWKVERALENAKWSPWNLVKVSSSCNTGPVIGTNTIR